MAQENIIIVGNGGHAAHLIDILESQKDKYYIVGVTAIDESKEFLGYKVLGDDSVLSEYYNQGIKKVVIGVGGGTSSNGPRIKLYHKLKEMGFEIETIVHDKAIVSNHCSIGEGVVIFPGVIIGPDVLIGDNTIVMTSSSVNHGASVGNDTIISAAVMVGGDVIIKNNVFVAPSVTIISGGITIEDNIVIGAGSTVLSSLIEEGIYIGTPAKKMNKK